MRTKIINDQLTDLFYNFIEMEDRIVANDRYADLNSSDMRFLSAVGKGSHPRTITQVGDYLRVGRQTAHHASSSLIRRGYITKMTNPNDARSQWLILTDKGMETVVYYRNRIRSNMKDMTKNFSEQEMDGMIGLLAQMKAAEGVTEELKRTHQMEWVQRCNNIHNRAEEIVLHEMIYS